MRYVRGECKNFLHNKKTCKKRVQKILIQQEYKSIQYSQNLYKCCVFSLFL